MDFSRKARWILDGHRSADPIGSTYAGVVSRDSVHISLTYASLNEIDVLAADIQNAYLQAPLSQKHYVICGAEFGLETCSSPRRTFFLHALSFECTSKLCCTFLNQFSDYFFHI